MTLPLTRSQYWHRVLFLGAVLCAEAASAQRGVPQSGFPNWHERTLLVLVNRWRADPSAETNNCSNAVVRAPLGSTIELTRAARFHSTLMNKSMQRMHNSPCVLATDIGTTYLPNSVCDGSVACACSTGTITCTEPAPCAAGTYSNVKQRLERFNVVTGSGWAENIYYGVSSGGNFGGLPADSFNWWLSSQGHCNNMNGNFTHMGAGYFTAVVSSNTYNEWTEDFTNTTAVGGTLIAGSHQPQLSGGSVTFLVNYLDSTAPQSAMLNVEGGCTTMTRQRGVDTNGTWSLTQTLAGTACRRYRFSFVDPRGALVYLPESGSYGVGGSVATCPDWSASEPAPCSGQVSSNSAPTVATAASASPNPVTASSAQLSVLGADNAGEPALTYTWASSGPTTVTFTPNQTNGSKTTTVTFSRVGTYSLTVTIKDAGGLTTSSSVQVIVSQTLTALTVSPAMATLQPQQQTVFTATAKDQFGDAMTASPSWVVSGGGTFNGGTFTAGSMPGGPFTVTATSGAISATAQVTIQMAPPLPLTVQLTQPTDGATVSGVVTLIATTSDDARAARVDFEVDGQALATDSSAPFNTLWNTSNLSGSHTLRAKVFDGVGASAASAEISVTVTPTTQTDSTPPTVQLDGPVGEVVGPATLRASAADDQGVVELVFEVDGVEVARLQSAPWVHEVPATSLALGSHLVRVTARDAAGNQATASGMFMSVSAPTEGTDAGAPMADSDDVPVRGGCGCTTSTGVLPWLLLTAWAIWLTQKRAHS